MTKRGLVLFAMAVCLALMATPVLADTIIDFQGGSSGLFSYDGNGGPLVGSGIVIDSVTGINTPANDGGVFYVTHGVLNFQTGSFVSFDAITGTYAFGSGGSITITGTCCNGAGVIAPLLSGSFLGASIGPISTSRLWLGNGPDNKDPELVEFFGLNPETTAWNFGGNGNYLDALPIDGGAFTVRAYSIDISNIADPAVAEPTSLVLIGSGLLGLYAIRRRMAKK